MPEYVLTVESRSGKPINKLTKEPWDSVAVYSDEDLKRRLDEVKRHPDLKATYRKVD